MGLQVTPRGKQPGLPGLASLGPAAGQADEELEASTLKAALTGLSAPAGVAALARLGSLVPRPPAAWSWSLSSSFIRSWSAWDLARASCSRSESLSCRHSQLATNAVRDMLACE